MDKIKAHFNYLLWIIPPVAICILLLLNEVWSIAAQPEVDLIFDVQQCVYKSASLFSGETPFLPKIVLLPVFSTYGLNEVMLRLPGGLFLIVVLFTWWFFGKKLLGEGSLNGALLVFCTTLLLPNVSKFATSDVWLAGFQLLHWLAILYLLKKPSNSWSIFYVLTLILGLLVAPVYMGIWSLLLSLFYFWKHPSGRSLKSKLFVVVFLSLLIGVFYQQKGLASALLVQYTTLGVGGWLGAQLLGIIPWLGFVLAGIKESVDKYRREEELATLMAGALLAGLFSGGVALQWVLALLAGKQLLNYFHPNYPNARWVKGGTVLVFLLAGLGTTVSMIWGYAQLDFVGYRIFMITGGLFWVIILIAVIGLYGKNYRAIALGFTMSGLLLNFGFWYRIAPLVEESRGWVKNSLTEMRQCQSVTKEDQLYILGENIPQKTIALYGSNHFSDLIYLAKIDTSQVNFASDPFLLIDSAFADQEIIRENGKVYTGKSLFSNKMPVVVYRSCE